MLNKSCWFKWQLACRRMQIDPFLSPCTKLKSKQINSLHIKIGTLKIIEEKVGKSPKHINTGKFFLNKTLMARVVRATIDKWDLLKLKSFCKAKDTVNRTIWQPADWEKIFTKPTFNRGLICNIYKEPKKLDSKEPNTPICKMG